MKKLLFIISFLITGIIFSAQAETIINNGYNGYFYSALSPHGVWMEIDYGVVVWRPSAVRNGWAPYTQGQWIWTSDGWYWDSYEPFGYVTYHYGRWYFDDYYGWIWMPDNEWAPAWVEWRYDDVYIGWAPLPPYASFTINIGIRYSNNYYTPYSQWQYVQYNHFCSPTVVNYFVAPKYKYRIHSKTKYRTNYVYRDGRINNYGVDIDYIRKRSGENIREREIERVSDASLMRNNSGERNNGNGKVRTFIAPREELAKGDSQDHKIEKSDRNTSLEISKIAVGNRESNKSGVVERKDIKKEQVIDQGNKSREEVLKENQRKALEQEKSSRNIDRSTSNRIQEQKIDKNNDRNIQQKKNESERTVNQQRKIETPKIEQQRKVDTQKKIDQNSRANNQTKTEPPKTNVEKQSAPVRNQDVQKRNNVKVERKSENIQKQNRTETKQSNKNTGKGSAPTKERGRR